MHAMSTWNRNPQLEALRDQTIRKLASTRHELVKQMSWFESMSLGASALGLQSKRVRHLSRFADRLTQLRDRIDTKLAEEAEAWKGL